MNSVGRLLKDRFRVEFEQRLREYLARNQSASECLRQAWENTLQSVHLDEADRAGVYWELLQWAREYELFIAAGQPAKRDYLPPASHPDSPD